ncbi:MAG: DUF6079 family protein [Pyrinomonadaceae bacterium]
MKRIQEKVKDLVEVHTYRSLQEFILDPAQTLSAYYFTDATSEMMAKWIDSLVEIQPRGGAAKALAGYRGVGKSHFLATLGAIASHPELRSKITDMHVAATAQRLKRRRHPVAFVRRGTHPTLLAEIRDAIAATFETNVNDLADSLPELLQFAAERAADLPFVLIVDTAFDRAVRVARDDGEMLGEIADVAKTLNIFAAVALDDDIAGADGVNAAIARSYTIDYLDQEHLYKIVDARIFPKHRHSQSVLHEIYTNFREALPSFQWSEQRFAALYPLHPVILETAPFVRLYVPDFAMLSFASEAGNKVLGRPANSLVALDEVFDRVENSLRKAKDLQEAFAAYDRLNSEIVGQVPVMQRLQAKLVLKALMLLSLDGDGTTAAEINAAMLIYDENDAQKAVRTVEELLEKFAAALPEEVRRKAVEGEETRFSLKVSSKDNLNDVLVEAAKNVTAEAIEKILRRFARERFSDWSLPPADESQTEDFSDSVVVWRGGNRRGRIVWKWQSNTPPNLEITSDFLDWEVIVADAQNKQAAAIGENSLPTVIWQAADLRPEEEQTLRRYHVLLTDVELQETFGEQIRAAGHTHRAAVEKIWERVFLDDGKLLIDGSPHSFNETALAAQSLSDLFSEMLLPLFNSRYPQHPLFARHLNTGEVAQLISEHFSGMKPMLPEVQELAKSFAAPLGLVALHGGNYVLNSDDQWLAQPFVKTVMSLVGESAGATVPLKIIYRELKKEPFGLVHEASQLVLAALVAARHLEFVTSKGDRINRCSLDLQIIWDDIEGVGAPETILYGSEKLSDWARTLTADNSFKTIEDPDDRLKIKAALQQWLTDWQDEKVLEKFEQLPDEILNTKIWRLATRAQKTFGVAAAAVELLLDETIALEEGLQRVADAFSDSEKEFFACTKNLVTLEDFINGAARREKIWNYLALCETTEDREIEFLRGEIYAVVAEMSANPSEALNQKIKNLWLDFHAKFAEHFNIKHYAIMKAHHLQEKFDEILRGDEWWEFENLSALPIFQKNYWRQAEKISRRLKELNCPFDLPELLETQPFCACSFRLSKINEWEQLPQTLAEIIKQGLTSYRKTISILGLTLSPILENISQTESSPEFVKAAAKLSEILAAEREIPMLDNTELVVLRKAVQAISASPFLQVAIPTDNGFLSREELRYRLTEWLDELPSDPVLLKV